MDDILGGSAIKYIGEPILIKGNTVMLIIGLFVGLYIALYIYYKKNKARTKK